jgi:hypothetical protein
MDSGFSSFDAVVCAQASSYVTTTAAAGRDASAAAAAKAEWGSSLLLPPSSSCASTPMAIATPLDRFLPLLGPCSPDSFCPPNTPITTPSSIGRACGGGGTAIPAATTAPAAPAPAALAAAAAARSSSSIPAAASSYHPLYKTELCKNWSVAGKCLYSAKCLFAHGQEELRQAPPRHPRWRTITCRDWQRAQQGGGSSSGVVGCPWGDRCRFRHDFAGVGLGDTKKEASPASSASPPLRRLPIFLRLGSPLPQPQQQQQAPATPVPPATPASGGLDALDVGSGRIDDVVAALAAAIAVLDEGSGTL